MVPRDAHPPAATAPDAGERTPPALVRFRARTLLVSHGATFASIGCVALYADLPGDPMHRHALLVLAAAQAAAGVVVGLLPWPRLFAGEHAERVLYGWGLLSLLAIAAAIGLTGGASSPLFLLYGVSTVFFASAWPLRKQATLALATVASYALAIVYAGGRLQPNVIFLRLSIFVVLAGLAAHLSHELQRQLASHVEARAELERRAAELERAVADREHLALHDSLTGLANRAFFDVEVERALAGARRHDRKAAVLVVDLNGFKHVNDVLGHRNGDELLREVAPRLRGLLRAEDVVARMGGDEFAVLLPEVGDADATAVVAAKLARALEQPFELAELTLGIEASIGAAVFPDHGADGDELVRHADAAMYSAKAEHSGWALYSGARDDLSPRRLEVLGELRAALEAGQVHVHYQPLVDMRDGSLVGFEALARWQHAVHGLIPPAEFVPLAEQTSLIGPLTQTVLDRAVSRCRTWRDRGHDVLVCVNVSARNLHDERFPDEVAAVLRRHGLPAGALELELTESAVMTQPKRGTAVLERLDAMGVRLALDDFGTGYSSLARLARLPVRTLKIDRGFVAGMSADPNDLEIVRSVINIGRNLGLTVVAEGVEDERAWQELLRAGCEIAQGYYLSPPLPAAELEPWLGRARAGVAA